MNTKNDNLMITAVVDFWVKYLVDPAIEKAARKYDNLVPAMSALDRLAIPKNKRPTAEQIKRFKESLTEYLEEHSKFTRDVVLSTEYGPNWPLTVFCHDAGIYPGTLFPQKLFMVIDFGNQKVYWKQLFGLEGLLYPVRENIKIRKRRLAY